MKASSCFQPALRHPFFFFNHSLQNNISGGTLLGERRGVEIGEETGIFAMRGNIRDVIIRNVNVVIRNIGGEQRHGGNLGLLLRAKNQN
jgi:hypothetical protein